MRKLNKENKAYIIALSTLALVILIAVVGYIIYKINDINIEYDIDKNSIVYNDEEELITIKSKTIAKKNLLGSYYLLNDKKKVGLGSNSVIFNKNLREIKLLGNYFEIQNNGEVNKIKGENVFITSGTNKIFKISDRKYLIISPLIKSEDGALNTNHYLLINIDKKGNAYLYNDKVNIKTFDDLVVYTDYFKFNVNAEELTINDEIIDLSKINGTTNTYEKKEKVDNNTTTENTTINKENNTEINNINPIEDIVSKEPKKRKEIQKVIEEKYINRKTTIIDATSTVDSIKVSYVIFDPFSEYQKLYVEVYDENELKQTQELEPSSTEYELKNLEASTKYNLKFYYTYANEDGSKVNSMFDSISVSTKNINASISLEKVSENSVRYILKVDDGYQLDSANVKLYIDGKFASSNIVNTDEAASKIGFEGILEYTESGDIATIVLTDCIYNNKVIDINANYKFKL